MKVLSSQALKTVNLGPAVHCGSTQFLPTSKAAVTDSGSKEDKNNLCMENDGRMTDENPPSPSSSLTEGKAPKKMVSINENVEHIIPSKKKKKKQPFKKSNSLDQEKQEEGEPKPVRSILKVGSDLNEKSNSNFKILVSLHL